MENRFEANTMTDSMEDMLIEIAKQQGVPVEEVAAILAIERECLDIDAKSEEPVKRLEELFDGGVKA